MRDEPTVAEASACAKVILCGECAVMYGRPAIAIPVPQVRAYARAAQGAPGTGLRFRAPDIGRAWAAADLPDDPLSRLASATVRELRHPISDVTITIASFIPIASGMGSSAAIATAVVRALGQRARCTLSPEVVSRLVDVSDERIHGRRSGIDSTTIAFELPAWFVKPAGANGRAQHAIPDIAAPFTFVIGDTGVRSPTIEAVNHVWWSWKADRVRYEALFDEVGALALGVRRALADGDYPTLGMLLDENQRVLERVGVSSPELECLIAAARRAGALGAKLSGAGAGGVMLALVTPDTRAAVVDGLRHAGAVAVLETTAGGVGAPLGRP